MSVLPEAEAVDYRLLAYKKLPLRFEGGAVIPIEVSQTSVKPLDSRFVFIGFDPVSNSIGSQFECSPLSCNHGAEERNVNRYCLLESRDEAVRMAAECSDPVYGWEPGPYFVIEVWLLLQEPTL